MLKPMSKTAPPSDSSLDQRARPPSEPRLSPLLESLAYLDLEVGAGDEIFRLGYCSPAGWQQASPATAQAIYAELLQRQAHRELICGHNIRRFDQVHLQRQWPALQSLLLIDTLELSVLAFPLAASHRLQKDYKLSEYASNDPLEDAQATQQLLAVVLQQLAEIPAALRAMSVWLLSSGQEAADEAYCQLFQQLGWQQEAPPSLDDLPASVCEGVDPALFLWATGLTSFDERLMLAALLAWNHARYDRPAAASAWLHHLPGFQAMLERLLPLTGDGFTYQPYLQAFGLEQFRPLQEAAVQAIIAGQNPFIQLPTGGGKSLCYQLPALMYHRRQGQLTVCISPLQALMADQVADLEAQGLEFATYINSNLPAPLRAERLEQLRNGQKGLLYIGPEQLRSLSIRALLEERLPVLWVIDEAHCISQWGHDFRPDYCYLPKFIQALYARRPLPRLACLTATATARVQADIGQQFGQYGLKLHQTLTAERQRPNLSYRVVPVTGNKEALMLAAVRQSLAQAGSALVYTATRREAEQLAHALQQQGIAAAHYHGQIPTLDKEQRLQAFKQGSLNVVTATSAFGMGINRKDVRAVVHYSLSSSLESYFQEAGRAGRDGLPAECLLLFDPRDAETIFFLRSLNQLSLTDLQNLFIAVRGVRDRLRQRSAPVMADWFWVTPEELYQTSHLSADFASDEAQRDTKIRVALHHLESFGLLERAENLSTPVQCSLRYARVTDAWRRFLAYAQGQAIKPAEQAQFEKLIYALYWLQGQRDSGERLSLERLSDLSGIPVSELPERIRELQRAQVCSTQLPLTMMISKGVKGDARTAYERHCQLAEQLLEALLPLVGQRSRLQLNLRGLATRLDSGNRQKLEAAQLLAILEGWQTLRWLQLQRPSAGLIELRPAGQLSDPLALVIDRLPQHHAFCRRVLACLYAEIDRTAEVTTGARLRLQWDLEQLLQAVCQRPPTAADAIALKRSLLWLHQQDVLRLTDGLLLFRQALKLRVIKGADIRAIARHYRALSEHYAEQTRKTHLLLQYGQLANNETARQQLVTDYFTLSPEALAETYPELYSEATQRPLTQQDYAAIMGPLNQAQQQIVEAEAPAMAVIAGPGSGKTRTIVHRIAYLIKVKRVHPGRILVLAYNRNAVRQLRLRLRALIGDLALSLRVYTFHGLALALLGRTVEKSVGGMPQRFEEILQAACDRLDPTAEAEGDDDSQLRRLRLLGNTEYLFVDEYQDVAEQEYRLIHLIAGLDTADPGAMQIKLFKLCVIGDDDQNIYEFRGTRPKYILQFEAEYQAARFLLTENYRSTEAIIAVANRVIQHNRYRCKRQPEEQVCIDAARVSQVGRPVRALHFTDLVAQAAWIAQQVQQWLADGNHCCDIAILAKHWNQLKEIRALLERWAGIPTYTLKDSPIKLVRHRTTQLLLQALEKEAGLTLSAEESVRDRVQAFFEKLGRNCAAPTVQTLLQIAADLDQERGYGSADLALPITAEEIMTAIYEFNENPENALDQDAILVTSCHGAKGLEFARVIVLTDGFATQANLAEAERRLFYVAMTRAKEELILCSTRPNPRLQETELALQPAPVPNLVLPRLIYYGDLNPKDVYLGYPATRAHQQQIKRLDEGEPLQLTARGAGWVIQNAQGIEVGALSRQTNQRLLKQGIAPGQFEFQPGEVQVKHLYRHLKMDDVTRQVLEDWYVVIPQIRVYRL